MANKFKVLLVHANTTMENIIPISAGILAGALRDKKIEYKIFDTTFYKTYEPYPDGVRVKNLQLKSFDYTEFGITPKPGESMIGDFVNVVDSYKPSLIAISVVEPTYHMGINLLRSVTDRKIPAIMGGITAFFSPEDIIKESCVDMVCAGEGEYALPELCERMMNNRQYDDIPGIWVKKKTGEVIRNEQKKTVDINEIPFLDFNAFATERFIRPIYGKKYRMICFELTRGCPYGCTYCASPSLREEFKARGGWYREKSFERIKEELDFYTSHHSVDFLYIVSDTFLAIEPKKLDKILTLLADLEIPFWMNTRPETITEERLAKLEKTKCVRMSIGIEHGNQKFRKKVLGRVYSNEACIEKLKIAGKSKIPVTLNNIIGFPGETRELVFDTIRLSKACLCKPADTASLFIFSPYRGTKLRKVCIENDYIPSDYWADCDNNVDRDFEMPTMTNAQIKGIMRTFSSYCKFPESDWPIIERAERFDAEGNRVFNEISKVFWSLERGESLMEALKRNGTHTTKR